LLCIAHEHADVRRRASSCKARGQGWSLTEIASSSENAFVASLLGGVDHWLGGNDKTTEGVWFWESGTQFWSGGSAGMPVGERFTNFVAGEPNDTGGTGAANCLRMVATGEWRDIGCSSVFRAVCESETL